MMPDNLNDLLEVENPPSGPEEQAKKYPALRFIVGLTKFLAVCVASSCFVCVVVFVSVDAPWSVKAPGVASALLCLVLVPVGLWASGESILVLIDIEENTRRKR